MAGDPADIGSAPVYFAIMIIEHVLVGHRGEYHIAAGGMQHAFGFAGGARRVEDEKRILRVHFFRRTIGRRLLGNVVIPNIAAFDPGDIATGAFYHDDFFDRWTLFECFIGIGFQGDRFVAADTFIRCDNAV